MCDYFPWCVPASTKIHGWATYMSRSRAPDLLCWRVLFFFIIIILDKISFVGDG